MAGKVSPPAKRVTLKKVVPKASSASDLSDPDSAESQLKRIQDNAEDALNALAAQLAPVLVPVAGLVMLAANISGAPTPGDNFQLCDGSTITDKRSPMRGQATPNINGNGWFVRGSSVAGTTQTADAVIPAHAHSMQAHTHDMNSHTHSGTTLTATSGSRFASAVAGAVDQFTAASRDTTHTTATTSNNPVQTSITGNTGGPSVANTLGPSVANTASDGGSGAETRPKNISAVFYIRIW